MAISSVSAENFKAFGQRVDIPLKPITVFIGANSAGKSSAIHVLAALKQSALRQQPDRALVLDGPDVLVKLGRYVDAVHGHDYRSQIGMGLRFRAKLHLLRAGSAGRQIRSRLKDVDLEYWWRFTGTLRTQRILLASRRSTIEDQVYLIRKRATTSEHYATIQESPAEASVVNVQNVGVRVQPNLVGASDDLKEFVAWQNLNLADESMLKELAKLRYLGPFRQPPQRLYAFHGTTAEVGADGRGAIPLLISEITGRQQRPNLQYVREWLRELGMAEEMSVARQGASDSFRVEVRSHRTAEKATPADIGYGFSQVLPVVVQCAFAKEGDTLLFEQPEIHLHPTAQRRLGLFFADTLRRRRATHVIETHSRQLVYGLQEAVRHRQLRKADAVIYAVRSEGQTAQLRSYSLDEEGDLWDQWDRGFVDPWD